MVLVVAVFMFALATAVFDHWKNIDLNVNVVEKMRAESEQRVPVLARALREWYLDEYCGKGAVENRKPMLPHNKHLACEALPVPPIPRSDLDSYTSDAQEPMYRRISLYLDENDATLRERNHGYTWEIYRPERRSGDNDMVEIMECTPTGMAGVLDCETSTVVGGPVAQIEISWSPPNVTRVDLEKLARAVGGTYAPAKSVGSGEIQDLIARAHSRRFTESGTAVVIGQSGIACMINGRSRERVRFPPVPAVAPPRTQDRATRRTAWSALFSASDGAPPVSRYNNPAGANDAATDEEDYLLWGC